MKHKLKIGLAIIVVAATITGIMVSGPPVASQDEAPESLWTVRCNEEGDKSCEVFQRLIVQETGQRVVEFAIGYPEGKKDVARGVIVMPLGILLPAGATMQIDEQPPFKFDVRFCLQNGCYAYLNLNDDIMGKLRKGKNASVTFKNAEGKGMSVDISLKGFAKSLDKIS